MAEYDDLLELYPTREALAEALSYRIEEHLQTRQELERERERKADATLTVRIGELERDLAKVNARLAAAQSLPSP